MKFLKCAFWTTAAAVVLAGGVSAQNIGGLGGTGGTTGGTGGTGGLGGISSSLGGTGGGGGGGLGGGGGGAGTAPGGTNSGVTSVSITAPSSYAQQPQSIATSNIVGRYYANPFWQGRAGTSTGSATAPSVVNPGGFGQATFGTSFGASTTGTAAGGRAGTVGGGGFGATTAGNARGMAGGLGTTGTTGNAQVVNQGAPGISYTATVKFDVAPISATQFQSDMQGVLSRTSGLSNPTGVQLTTGPNGAVTLRGQVRDADEARLIEGLMRTTPGVRNVTNELQFPRQ